MQRVIVRHSLYPDGKALNGAISKARALAKLAALLVLFTAQTAWAQTVPARPPTYSLVLGTAATNGYNITQTWTASPTAGVTYRVFGGYNTDNSEYYEVNLPAGTLTYTRVFPFHKSGTAQPMWACVAAILNTVKSENSCGSLTIPAKTTTPPRQVTVTYTEPTTNDCVGWKPPPDHPEWTCPPMLDDLGKTTVYGRVDAGTPTKMAESAAVLPTGGQSKTLTFNAPATTGMLYVWVTATDIYGNESKPSPEVSAPLSPTAPGKGTINLEVIIQ